jgi:aryl-alcohol dehydrogenase-like predicted oxidoreductase
MKYRLLGTSDLNVSELCLGSMTWGTQNTEAEGHAQIDVALDHGVNFIDTAEIYPTNPTSVEKAGATEAIIGTWLAKSGQREKVIIATKVAGPNNPVVRNGGPLNAEAARLAIEGSLSRLQTDYIDLYQIHWPQRGGYGFRQNWAFTPSKQDRQQTLDAMSEVMVVLAENQKAGRIRHFGLSNETAWGCIAWNRLAQAAGGPRVVSIQNEYSLLCRLFDTDLAEVAHHEQIGLLAYSPIACGLLSGKYAGGEIPEGSRRSITPDLFGRVSDRVWPAIDAYLGIAQEHGLEPSQMALAWTLTRPFMGAAIFGATSQAQLLTALGAADLVLSPEVMAAIERTHKAHPMPY